MNSILLTLALLISSQSVMAFGFSRIKPPAPLASFTAIDETGKAALEEIQQTHWGRSKLITVLPNNPLQFQILARQTAEFSLQGNSLEILSSTSYHAINNEIFGAMNHSDHYSTRNTKAPVIYTGQKISEDGTVQIAIGVDYKKGVYADENFNKITLTMWGNNILYGPDSYESIKSLPDFQFDSYVFAQYVVLSWNKNNPNSLTIKGIANSDSVIDQFSTDYGAE